MRKTGIGWLIVAGILLWAFVLRPKAEAEGETPPAEFRNLQVTAVPGSSNSPATAVGPGDTVGIASGTVQYRGPAGQYAFGFYLYKGTATTYSYQNSTTVTVPECKVWTTINLPRVTTTIVSGETYEGSLEGRAYLSGTFTGSPLYSARTPVYDLVLPVPAAEYSSISVSWV